MATASRKEADEPTPFGGSLAYSKLIRHPRLTVLWSGYPFSADFNEERSHCYSQIDQVETKRNNKAWLNAHGFPKFKGQPGSCMTCHPLTEKELRDRILFTQKSTSLSLRLAEGAILALIEDVGRAKALILAKYNVSPAAAPEEQEKVLAGPLAKARDMHRRASLRWDFIYSENSTGFHSPQESARVLAQAVDFARRGQLELQAALKGMGLSILPETGAGKTPPRPAPIPGADPRVGREPPGELLKVDNELL